MSTLTSRDDSSTPGGAGAAGGGLRLPRFLAVGYGVLTVLLGIAVLVWPQATLTVAVVVIAAQLMLTAVLYVVMALSEPHAAGGERALLVLAAALSLLVALLILRKPLQTLILVTLLIGAGWVVRGVIDMVGSIPGGRPHRGWSFVFGLVSLVAGGYVLTNPGLSLVTFIWLSGLWMIAYGGLVITASLLKMR